MESEGRKATVPGFDNWTPQGEAERDAVQKQLEHLLAHPLFRNSKRYPNLLKHIVELTLSGNRHLLKERTLGIDVFGRAPDYDTNTDPVVRMTAVEIRKRIAQYYSELEHEEELRIDLPPGSYEPVFSHKTSSLDSPSRSHRKW